MSRDPQTPIRTIHMDSPNGARCGTRYDGAILTTTREQVTCGRCSRIIRHWERVAANRQQPADPPPLRRETLDEATLAKAIEVVKSLNIGNRTHLQIESTTVALTWASAIQAVVVELDLLRQSSAGSASQTPAPKRDTGLRWPDEHCVRHDTPMAGCADCEAEQESTPAAAPEPAPDESQAPKCWHCGKTRGVCLATIQPDHFFKSTKLDPSGRWWMDTRNTNAYLCCNDGIVAGFAGQFTLEHQHELAKIAEAHNETLAAPEPAPPSDKE